MTDLFTDALTVAAALLVFLTVWSAAEAVIERRRAKH